MAEAFVGKWNLVGTENFDEYMKAVGVGLLTRKTAGALKPSQEISINGDTVTIKTSSTFKNTEVSFKLGEAFDETTGDGRKMKTTFRVEDGKLIADQQPTNDTDCPSVHTRQITAEGMTMTLEAKDVVCKRMYKH